MTFRAVLFDWDGTLVSGGPATGNPVAAAVESLRATAGIVVAPAALQAALAAAIPPYTPGVIAAVEPFPVSLGRALGSLGLAAPPDALAGASLAAYLAFTAADRLFDDARALLASLRYRGYEAGVVTNTNFPAACVAVHAARLGVAGYLGAIVCSADVGAGKPDPAIFGAALRVLGLSAAEVLFVGDRIETDIAGALAAGLTAVLLDRTGTAPRPPAGVVVVPRLTALNSILGEGSLSGAGAIL